MKRLSLFAWIKVTLVLVHLVAVCFVIGWNSAHLNRRHTSAEKRTIHSSFNRNALNLTTHLEEDQPLVRNSLLTVLREGQRSRPWIILATTNKAFLDFTDNWLESLKRCGIRDHVTIYAEDQDAHDYLSRRKDIKLDVRLTSATQLPGQDLAFGSQNYLKLVNKRPAYILRFLENGVDVLFTDVDTVWLQNPLPFFSGDYDIHFEKDLYEDEKRPDMICAGFVYYSATNATINFIQKWMSMIQRRPTIPDQQLLNQLLRNQKVRKSLKLNILDPRQFPNGNDFFNEEWRTKHADTRPVVVHNNWIKGHDVKIERFRNVSMWYL